MEKLVAAAVEAVDAEWYPPDGNYPDGEEGWEPVIRTALAAAFASVTPDSLVGMERRQDPWADPVEAPKPGLSVAVAGVLVFVAVVMLGLLLLGLSAVDVEIPWYLGD